MNATERAVHGSVRLYLLSVLRNSRVIAGVPVSPDCSGLSSDGFAGHQCIAGTVCPGRRLGFKYSNTICAYVSAYRAIGVGCTAACESVSALPQALCGTVNAAPALGRIRQSLEIVTPSACQSSLTMCSGVSERGGCEYSRQASRSGFSRYEFPCVAARCARHRRARDSDARRQSNQCAAYRARSSHALSS